MKLIIQIPCYNEEKYLPQTLSHLPREVEGFDRVEWLIINDGSRDNTVQVAKQCGVDHVVTLNRNKGLSRAYMAGIEESLRLGADVIVNTDADGQYDADDIKELTKPILEDGADIVVGERPIDEIEQFSLLKKMLQKLGSYTVRKISKTDIPDAPSGFRAISKYAAMKLNVFNNYTYTIETIIQAGRKNMAIVSVPIRVNKVNRPSRLMKNIWSYMRKTLVTMIRIFVVYKPFRFFFVIGSIFFFSGFLIGIRFLYFYFFGRGSGHVQSLIFAAVLLGMGFQTILVAFLADLFAVNRTLLEDVQYRLRKIEFQKSDDKEKGIIE
jgi:glycosyltransferase involved in cell wall biosynthesis